MEYMELLKMLPSGAAAVVAFLILSKQNKPNANDEKMQKTLDGVVAEQAEQKKKIEELCHVGVQCDSIINVENRVGNVETRVENVENNLQIQLESSLWANGDRINRLIDSIHSKLDTHDGETDYLGEDINDDVMVLFGVYRVFHKLGGNGDFDCRIRKLKERIQNTAPLAYKTWKRLEEMQ